MGTRIKVLPLDVITINEDGTESVRHGECYEIPTGPDGKKSLELLLSLFTNESDDSDGPMREPEEYCPNCEGCGCHYCNGSGLRAP